MALLSARTRDIAAAEDALGDAFAAALAQWPVQGVPDRPDAWLMAAAQRRLADAHRRQQVRERAAPVASQALHGDPVGGDSVTSALDADGSASAGDDGVFPDRRVDLLFACAHPAIDESIRTPLMLQVVLGLDASVVAAAFLTAPATMAQRLVRAKRKLRDAGVPFEVPPREQLPARLSAVLEAVYGAFGAAWLAVAGGEVTHDALADEAIWLARVLADALPGEPEALGLLALLLYCHARRGARYTVTDAGARRYVPLDAQEVSRWDMAMIGEAESLLRRAAQAMRPGRFQLEAALQSVHLAPAFGRPPDRVAIVALHEALLVYAPTVGGAVSRVAAIGEAHGAMAGLAAADALAREAHAGRWTEALDQYQPWWALRAHLLAHVAGGTRRAEADVAYQRAAGLATDPAVRAFLLERAAALREGA